MFIIPSEVITLLLMASSTSFGTLVAIFASHLLYIQDWNVLALMWSSSILISDALMFKYHNTKIAVDISLVPRARDKRFIGFFNFLWTIWSVSIMGVFSLASVSIFKKALESSFGISVNQYFSTLLLISTIVYTGIFLNRWYKKYQ
jgi:hypothetical protein